MSDRSDKENYIHLQFSKCLRWSCCIGLGWLSVIWCFLWSKTSIKVGVWQNIPVTFKPSSGCQHTLMPGERSLRVTFSFPSRSQTLLARDEEVNVSTLDSLLYKYIAEIRHQVFKHIKIQNMSRFTCRSPPSLDFLNICRPLFDSEGSNKLPDTQQPALLCPWKSH